jgi:enamine deaminase RidA (YjgF/YER057c/UK114 family)
MESIKSLLEANGATMDDVVKCTVFLADFAEWGAMNEVYTTFFPKHRPARSAVAVSGLASNARVEIECMAVIGARNAS